MAGPHPIADPAPSDGFLPVQVLDGASTRSFHAYLHIPFCRVRCGYCDFNTYTSTELRGEKQSDFAARMISEIAFSVKVQQQAQLPARPLASVFFGGGTPTQLPAEDLVSILGQLERSFGFAAGCEITTEANPDDVSKEYLEKLARAGFTRVSIGMQSSVPSVLATLERTHNPVNVATAVALAKSVGLQTSVDLIYGAPGETMDDWVASLESAIELETDHVSAYSLIVEPGTKMARQIKSGLLTEQDPDELADKYELAEAMLSAAGFEWYEVSNWSRGEGARSVHNLAYWRGNDWWGYGPGAHSHIGGVRWWNAKHPSTYAQKVTQGESPAVGRETLDQKTRLEERILLELRIADGISIETIKALNSDANRWISQYIATELIDAASALRGHLVLTLKGRLLADSMVRQLLT